MYWWEGKGKWFDCFFVLGISENATLDDVKKAYRGLMKKVHPDVNPNYDTDEIARIELAYNTLSDPKMRERYEAFSKRYKEKQENENSKNTEKESKREEQDKGTSFDKAYEEYKKSEKNLKVIINVSIKNIEEEAGKFSLIYDSFCEDIKNSAINSKTFEIRKQKMRSIMLAGVNNIKEIRRVMSVSLSNINFENELVLLSSIEDNYISKDDILTSSYSEARRKLNGQKVKSAKKSWFKKCPIKFELAFTVALFALGIYFISPLGRFWDEKEEVVEEMEETEEISEEVVSVDEKEVEEDNMAFEEDCILFESVPETMEYDTMTDPFEYAGREVISARKDGIQYLLDATDKHVLIANYLSSGPVFGSYLVFLGKDGRDYTVDIRNFRTVLEVEDAYYSESEPFYLDGYGYVIETESHGGKHLIDAETRESLVDLYDTYGELYYDENLESEVYCFTNEYTDTYVQADDLKKVLKIEHN